MSKVILLVDDLASMRSATAFPLKLNKYTVIEAVNGLEALKELNGQVIDLVITDLNMPLMDGLELIKKIRKDPLYTNYKNVPIMMLTTESQDKKLKEAKEVGLTAWLTKPFEFIKFVETVKKLIR